MSDSTILPASVAVERTGIPADELRHTWGVQELVQRFADGIEQAAFLVSSFLLPGAEVPARKLVRTIPR